MPDIYVHDVKKFSSGGLQLRVPVDLVPEGQYSRLTNATPIIEGRLEGRAGLQFIVKVANTTSPGSGLHSLTRLNQPSVAGVGDRIAGIDTTVQTFSLPAGSVATSRDTLRDGNPLTLASFHFQNDSSAWQVLADRADMKKYKGGASGSVYAPLGITSPANQDPNNRATAVDGGVGLLNNGAGPAYDWLYTYVNTTTLTESNPSDLNIVPSYSHTPGTTVTPDPGFGGPNTGAGFTLTANSAAETRQSANASNFPATTATMELLRLYINLTLTVNVGTAGGCAFGCFQLSLDGGTTWKLISDTLAYGPGGPGGVSFVVNLPPTQDMTKLQVRAVLLGVGVTTVPQNITARRIRDRAGNFNVTDLLTGGGGNASIAIGTVSVAVSGIDVTQTATTLALANRQANVSVLSSNDLQVDAVRLYRRGGSVTGGWAFVGQFPVTPRTGTVVLVDNVPDTSLGSFVQFTNDAPVTSIYLNQRKLPYIWGPGFNPSRMLGCGDPDRPDAVYFSNPGNADQWGVGQWIDVSSPSDAMQNGCVYNTRVFAFSHERMFELLPSVIGGATLTPFQTPCSRGLISPYGLTSTARMVYFVAKDGIYATTGGEEHSLVENSLKPLFPTLDNPLGRAVEGYDLIDFERIEDLRLAYHNDELYFIYRGKTDHLLHCLVYDQTKDRWRAANFSDVQISAIYSEEGTTSSILLGDTSGAMYSTAVGQGDVLQASTIDIPVTIRTGAYDQGAPLVQKEYGSVIFDLDPGGATIAKPITITPLRNGEAITGAAITVTGTGRQQVPLPLGDVFGFNIEFDITFVRNAAINPVLFQFDTLWRPEPVSVIHWEARETSHRLPGYQHLRDMYLPIRSTTPVVLTCTFDINTNASYSQTYTVPSTGGARLKVYIPFNSNKFKTVRYSLDSTDITQPFRIYEDDLEVRVKPWLTTLGYIPQRPFGGEAPSASAWFETKLLGGR